MTPSTAEDTNAGLDPFVAHTISNDNTIEEDYGLLLYTVLIIMNSDCR